MGLVLFLIGLGLWLFSVAIDKIKKIRRGPVDED